MTSDHLCPRPGCPVSLHLRRSQAKRISDRADRRQRHGGRGHERSAALLTILVTASFGISTWGRWFLNSAAGITKTLPSMSEDLEIALHC